KKGKAIGLFNKDWRREAQFFSPTKVEAVQQRAIKIKLQKEKERINLANRRI
ncbi:hypothetical protein BKA66DRAFT_435378, partial [Pyrenochaeta sp. MPI-SDFR-AT-0127]